MRIVIDLQGAQSSGSRNRGIGRYTLSLVQAIVRNKGEHEVIIALNGLFLDSIEPIRAAFEGLLPQANIRVWQAPGPVNRLNTDNDWRRRTAELIREAFLASLRPDMVLVTSLFEAFFDDAVTSIGSLSLTIPTSVILYDLIPLIHRHPYLENPAVEAWYENKLDHLRRADLLLAISESSRQESIRHLSFSPEQAVNISTAADPHFLPQQVNKKEESEIRQRYSLQRPFVMYASVPDYRKNHEGLIRAYARLSKQLRASHQLLLACSSYTPNHDRLKELAKNQGLLDDEVVIIGFVTDVDLIILYNLCKTFVFPSWHEGFGLPALEAMSCGRAVIAANTSSLPEVIGRDDALFDPHSDESIADKLTQVLSDSGFRQQLEQHGLKQAKCFSWDASAVKAIVAMEASHANLKYSQAVAHAVGRRPKLAYISPLPPERSGISDYSAQLLPELARHYDIEVIVAQDSISNSWINANCPVRTVEWFKAHANHYDRVLYHFGNSHFHQHMFELLDIVPGTIVLHDFFLGHIAEYIGAASGNGNTWPSTLYEEHGYALINERFKGDISNVVWNNPCNLRVLQKALGVIVHSEDSKRLATLWHGEHSADEWSTIPLMRTPALETDRGESRNFLSIDKDVFVVCSFGLLGPNKNNHRLLDSWLASKLAQNDKCVLVFVGENSAGEYGIKLLERIASSGLQARIRITGWTDTVTFQHYLTAADVGVQLRTLSRGETSAAVLDCMNYGLATIVNSHGSLADLPNDGVWKLSDEFGDEQLIEALESLWREAPRRKKLGEKAREIVLTRHAPRTCADQYVMAIEGMYRAAISDVNALSHALIQIDQVEPGPAQVNAWVDMASAIAMSIPPQPCPRQLLIDISALVQADIKTGIQRVVRSILHELLTNPPAGFRVEPVYATHAHGYRYARAFTLSFLGCPESSLADEPIEFNNGDFYLGLDLHHNGVLHHEAFYQQMRHYGVQVFFVVYDLLPVLCPDVFPEGVYSLHASWLNAISQTDGAICISRAVAGELSEWLTLVGPERLRPFKLGWVHLGADVKSSVPTIGLPGDANHLMRALSKRPTFLMVGTVEPRKGHLQTLSAFEQLWAEGADVNLIVVGHEGWKGMSNDKRRTIPLITSRLLNHPKRESHLFWLQGISDEYLEKIYAASTCLIAASEGEGFGLPLIEAAQHKLPIIARDIPVFREVAGVHALYFSGLTPNALANCVREWLALDKAGQAPQSDTMPWLTWKQSTQNLLDVMLGGQWYQQWMPDDVYRFWGGDSRLNTQVGKRTGRNMVSAGEAGYLLYGPYIPLVAGKYWVMIRGGIGENGLAGAHMDAVTDKGSVLLGKSVLSEPDENGNFVALLISLDVPCTDLEVRVWVSKNTDLHVSMIEIAPWQDEQETSNTEPGDISEVDSPDREAASIEPADRQEMTRGMSFSPPVAEPAPDAMLVEVEAEVSQQELAESSALVQPALSAPSNKFAVVNDDSDPFPAPQSAEVEMLFDSAQASNDPSAPGVMPIPSAAQNKWQPTSTERNRAKTKRKKNR